MLYEYAWNERIKACRFCLPVYMYSYSLATTSGPILITFVVSHISQTFFKKWLQLHKVSPNTELHKREVTAELLTMQNHKPNFAEDIVEDRAAKKCKKTKIRKMRWCVANNAHFVFQIKKSLRPNKLPKWLNKRQTNDSDGFYDILKIGRCQLHRPEKYASFSTQGHVSGNVFLLA